MKNIYQHTECLTDKILIGYHKNELSPKEMNRVENHLIDCEMCRDALEGIEQMQSVEKLPIIVEQLNEKIDEKTSNKRKLIGFRQLKYIGLAASIIILVGLSIFLGRELTKSQEMAMCDNVENQISDFENAKTYKEETEDNIGEEKTYKEPKDKNEKKLELKEQNKIEDIIEIVEDNDIVEDDMDFDFDEADDEKMEIIEESENYKKNTDTNLQLNIVGKIINVTDDRVANIISRNEVLDELSYEEELVVAPTESLVIARKENNLWKSRSIWTKNKSKKTEAQTPVMEDFTNTSDLVYTARNYQELGDYSNSIIYYDKILENKNDPYYYEAKYNKAKILIEENKNDEALKILKELSEEKNNYQDSAKVLIKKINK